MTGELPSIPSPALRLWRELAGDPEVGTPGTRKVVRRSRGLAPPGWTAVLRLGDAWAIDPGEADTRTVVALLDLDDPADPAQVAGVVDPVDTLGPGELAYLPASTGGGTHHGRMLDEMVLAAGADVEVAEVEGHDIASWLATLPSADLEESSVGDMDRVLVAEDAGRIVAAAGHLPWPADIAHIGVVVAPTARGRGYGRVIGAAATRRAIAHGLVPQWRAAMVNDASRAVAARIGYVEVGRQYSFRL